MQKIFHKVRAYNKSISVSEKVCTYLSPDPTLTITCYQLIVVGWGAVPSTLTLTDIPTLIITKKHQSSLITVHYLTEITLRTHMYKQYTIQNFTRQVIYNSRLQYLTFVSVYRCYSFALQDSQISMNWFLSLTWLFLCYSPVDTGIGQSFKKFFSFFSSDDDKEVWCLAFAR